MYRTTFLGFLLLSTPVGFLFPERASASRTSGHGAGSLARPMFSLPTQGEAQILTRMLQAPAAASHFANTQWIDVSGVVEDSGEMVENVGEALFPALAHLYTVEEFQTVLREKINSPEEIPGETLAGMAKAMRAYMEEEGSNKVAEEIFQRLKEVSNETPIEELRDLYAKIETFAKVYDAPEIDIRVVQMWSYIHKERASDREGEGNGGAEGNGSPILRSLLRRVDSETMEHVRGWSSQPLEKVVPSGRVFQSGDAVLIAPNEDGEVFFGQAGRVRVLYALEDEGAKQEDSPIQRFKVMSDPTSAERWAGELQLSPEGAELRVRDVEGWTAFGKAVSEGAKKIFPAFVETSLGHVFSAVADARERFGISLHQEWESSARQTETESRLRERLGDRDSEISRLKEGTAFGRAWGLGSFGAIAITAFFPGLFEFLGIAAVSGVGWLFVFGVGGVLGLFVMWVIINN